ncbi:MAG: ATP synthase F1 subunit delta, partial [Candidatus Bipolaricaulota bacterium]
ISRESFNFLKLLIDNGREDYLELIFERVLDIRSEKENILNANVFVPEQFETAVSAEEYADRLSKRLGKKVVVNRVIGDPSLIAGIKVQIGNRIIDGSAKSRIKQMRDFVLEGGKDG